MKHVDLSKTLDELEGVNWGEPNYPSSLVTECHRLRKVPLKDFTPGNLRIMIGQQISLEYLVPLALKELSTNPFVEGNFYPGDLLANLLKVPDEFWKEHQDMYGGLTELIVEIENLKEAIDDKMMPEIQRLRQLKQTL